MNAQVQAEPKGEQQLVVEDRFLPTLDLSWSSGRSISRHFVATCSACSEHFVRPCRSTSEQVPKMAKDSASYGDTFDVVDKF